MTRLLATIVKDLLILSRDKAGMLVLFLMPAVLVVIVSLVQENILKVTGETSVRILFVDHDRQLLGSVIENRLQQSGAIELIKELNGKPLDEPTARAAVEEGDFQFGMVIPAGATEAAQSRLNRQILSAFDADEGSAVEENGDLPRVKILFDPLVQGAFRASVANALHSILLALELEMKARAVSEIFPQQAARVMQKGMHRHAPDGSAPPLPQLNADWGRQRMLGVESQLASRGNNHERPSSVQQNVPAWALFGMFFIVVPMGGSLIRERQEGTLLRQMSLPVSYLTILAGKLCAYVLVCCLQFGAILAVGKYALPLLGTPVLEIGSSPLAIVIVVCSAALAAAGYGVLLGTIARTYEQASMFGAVSVVIAAAIGGIMVPVYAMPRMMQQFSQISPLAWGLNALVDLFARDGTIQSVFPETVLLLAFFAGTLLLSRAFFRNHRRP